MNAGALSNSLFVNNIAAMTQQCSTKSSGPKLRDNEIAEQVDVSSEPREVEAIEQNHSSNSEPIEFKRALEKQSDNQTDVQKNEQETSKSDNSTEDNTAKYDLAATGALSTQVELLGQQTFGLGTEQTDSLQVSVEQKVLASLSYQQNSMLTPETGDVAEMLSNTAQKISINENGSDITVTAGGIAEQKPVQTEDVTGSSLSEGQTTELQQAIKTADNVVKGENGQQVNQQTAELNIDSEGENGESQQEKDKVSEVLGNQIIPDAKTAQPGDTPVNDAKTKSLKAENTEQMTEAVTSQIKSSNGKEISEDESQTLLKQDSSEPRYIGVINTDPDDAAEKGADVSKTLQPNQTLFDKDVFDKVGEQLQTSISNSVRQGESEISVRLNPPELGQVVIKLQHQNGQVTGSLEFSRAETRVEVQQLMPQLVRNLQDSGIAVRKLDVVQTQIDNSGQQQFREHVAGDGLAYQQQFSQGQSENYGLGYDWISTEPVYGGIESLSESYIGDQAVNILV
jgi:flagellar hook-length control protein FliK